MTLIPTAVSGVKWSSTSQFGRQMMQWVTTIILARLLDPSDFGLMSMVMIVIGFISLFKDFGTSAAVIQKKDPPQELLTSIFWINVLFGFIAMISLYFFSPVISNFFNEPKITPLLKVLSLTFFISGLSILQQSLLEKNLKFRMLAFTELLAVAVGSLVGIAAALSGAGVWSLVYQSIAVVTINSLIILIFSGWVPRMIFRGAEINAIAKYSMNLMGFNIFNYFVRNFDNLLIGKFLGAGNLGYYSLAYKILLYPLQNISAVIGRVLFPIYSQIQDDDDRFRRGYLKVAGFVALVTFPMMAGLWVLAKPVIRTVFGSNWVPVIPLILIFSPLGIIQSVGTTVGVIYQAKGRTDLLFGWGIGAGLTFILAFILGLRGGITGVALSYVIASLILFYPNFSIPFKLIGLKIRDLLRVTWKPLLSSFSMVLIIYGFRSLFDLTDIQSLGLSIPMGILIYSFVSWLIDRDQIQQFINIIFNKM